MLGDSKQWILIRGSDRNNPLLLFLHGGPGMPMMYLAHDFQRELERSFVVAQWDRRGAGKSFTAGMSSQRMSVSQEINDTIELIDQLRARFHQPKVYMVGFSYGSYLGILVTQHVPERLHAYVGIGQLACSEQENRTIQDTWIREQATRTHDQEPIDELNGKKPLDRERWLFKYGGEIHSAHTWWPLLWSGLRCPEYGFQDVVNVKRGVDFTARNLRYDVIDGSILDNGILYFWRSHLGLPRKCGALRWRQKPLKKAAIGKRGMILGADITDDLVDHRRSCDGLWMGLASCHFW